MTHRTLVRCLNKGHVLSPIYHTSTEHAVQHNQTSSIQSHICSFISSFLASVQSAVGGILRVMKEKTQDNNSNSFCSATLTNKGAPCCCIKRTSRLANTHLAGSMWTLIQAYWCALVGTVVRLWWQRQSVIQIQICIISFSRTVKGDMPFDQAHWAYCEPHSMSAGEDTNTAPGTHDNFTSLYWRQKPCTHTGVWLLRATQTRERDSALLITAAALPTGKDLRMLSI